MIYHCDAYALPMPYIDFEQLLALEPDLHKPSPLSWRSAGLSHVGHVRKANEDAFYHSTDAGLWVVADGMGGLARGDYASAVVVDAFVHFIRASTLAGSIRDLEMRLREAHNSCRSAFPGERVGSTVAALLNYGQYGFVLWAGDSRVYRLRQGELTLLTTDHTVAQEKLARGEMTSLQAARDPSAHVLTRAVGVHQTLHLDLDYAQVLPGDRFLLCSDGLYQGVPETEIQQLLRAAVPMERALETLIDHALDGGGTDNITAIIADAS